MRVFHPRFDRTPVLTTDFSSKKGSHAVMRLLSLLVVFAIPVVVQASGSLPAAKYGADAYAGGYLLPPCGLSCAELTVPGTVTDSSISGPSQSSMASATLTGSPIPMVSAHANAGIDSAVAAAQIVYYMEITGGLGTPPVTLDVFASGFASASGGGAAAGGALEIQDSSSLAIVADWTTCANTISAASCSGLPLSFNLLGAPVALSANTLYAVNITASGSVGGCLSPPCALQTGDAQAFTDPWFMIDPSTPDLSLYSLDFSAGIGNTPLAPVPEPGTWALLVGGIAMFGAAKARTMRAG
jgi:PEP-CTERM motif